LACAVITDPACRGAQWVRPIAEIDVYRHFHALTTIAGQGQVIDGIASAAPPATPAVAAAATGAGRRRERAKAAVAPKDMGSNAIAIGSAGTRNRRGLLLGNPHYPWQGGRRFWQSQLTCRDGWTSAAAVCWGFRWCRSASTGTWRGATPWPPRYVRPLQARLASPTSYWLTAGRSR
jgi:hypothetical protein